MCAYLPSVISLLCACHSFFSDNLLFSLPLLASCLPTSNKHWQTHTSAHTHTRKLQFTVLRMVEDAQHALAAK